MTKLLGLFLVLGTAPLSAQTYNDYSPNGHLNGSAGGHLSVLIDDNSWSEPPRVDSGGWLD